MTGAALRMQLEIKRLRDRWRTPPVPLITLPLAPSSTKDVIVQGYASTPTVDAARQLIRPYALSWLPRRLPPLLYRHGEEAGIIESLEYDDDRRLCITARVSHDVAKRCMGFSVGATGGLRDTQCNSPDFHAVVMSAWLDEVSMTPVPCNTEALVRTRYPAPAAAEF